jgi:hypothetical protein
MTVIAMSRTEIDRMSVLHDLADGRIRIAEASTLMGLGRRQVFRLAKAYGRHGPQALVSRRRGRPSNRCHPTPDQVTFLTGANRDFSNWWRHPLLRFTLLDYLRMARRYPFVQLIEFLLDPLGGSGLFSF